MSSMDNIKLLNSFLLIVILGFYGDMINLAILADKIN